MEQRCATQRMMTAVDEAWKKSDGTLTKDALGRVITIENLRSYANIANKYVSGMKTQVKHTGVSALETMEYFASGIYDGYLHQVRDESMASYWPWS